jgi:hypothetical protein
MATTPHATLTGVDQHEPKGVQDADLGDVYVADGNGSGTWDPQVVFAYPPKFIAGMTYENSSGDATNDIVVLSGYCRDSTNTEDIDLASSITKQLDAAWAVGTDAGGLDEGTIADATYHIFVIKRTDTDVVDVLFSLSPTAPTMPTDYTKFRRVGSFLRASSVIMTLSVAEMAGGAVEVLRTPILDVSVLNQSTVAISRTLSVPTGVKFSAIVSGITSTNSGGTGALLLTSLDQADTAASTTGIATTAHPASDLSGFSGHIRTNTSAQIRTRASAANNVIRLTTHGWIDYRR